MTLTEQIEFELNKRVKRAEALVELIKAAKLAECELHTLKDEIKKIGEHYMPVIIVEKQGL